MQCEVCKCSVQCSVFSVQDTERRLEEATSKLAVIQEEKKQWLFMEQVSNRRASSGTDKCLGVAGSLWHIFAAGSGRSANKL